MQVKKEEMRQKIIEVATDEFLKRGYENASMRTIAQKSHTTLGNIYHYFKNKEVLLETILIPTFENIESLMGSHIAKNEEVLLTRQQALEYANHLEEYIGKSELRCFFDKRVVIILKLESSPLLGRKESMMLLLQNHLQDHFHMKDDAHYSKIVLEVLADCLKHVLIEHENMEDAQMEFIKLFRIFCTGVVGQIK